MDLVSREYLLQNDYIGPFPSWAVFFVLTGKAKCFRKRFAFSSCSVPAEPLSPRYLTQRVSESKTLILLWKRYRDRAHTHEIHSSYHVHLHPAGLIVLWNGLLKFQYGFQLRNNILLVWGAAFPPGCHVLHETPAKFPLNRKLRLPLAIWGSSHWINNQQVSLYWPCCFSTGTKEWLDCYHTVKKR